MTDYNFLANLTLVDKGRVRQPKTKSPEGLRVRVFSDGSVYPSHELVSQFNLEYTGKGNTGTNGFDVVDSKRWTVLPTEAPRMILFGLVPKEEAKVTLFGSCKYNEGGQPKSSVLTQGSTCEELLSLVKEFGWLTEEQTYVDLKVMTEHPVKTTDGVAYIPKTIAKGKNKGEETYEKREQYTLFPVEATDLAAMQGNVQTIPATETHELVAETIN